MDKRKMAEHMSQQLSLHSLLAFILRKKNKNVINLPRSIPTRKNCALGLLKTSGTVSSNHGPPSRGKTYISSLKVTLVVVS